MHEIEDLNDENPHTLNAELQTTISPSEDMDPDNAQLSWHEKDPEKIPEPKEEIRDPTARLSRTEAEFPNAVSRAIDIRELEITPSHADNLLPAIRFP